MLSSTIKSNAFIPYRESCFNKMTNLERRKVFYFCLRLLSRNVLCKAFIRNPEISPKIVGTHVKFCPKSFSFGILLQKSCPLVPSCSVKFISPVCHNSNFSYLYMESEPGFFLKIISNLNLRTKFESFSIVL